MRTLVYLFLLTLCCGCGQADTPAQSAVPAGIIILREVPGYPAAATPFVSIQWVNTNGGYVADAAGNKTPFINDAIGKIIYFNQNYYDEINHDQYWVDWRAGLQSREVVMPPSIPSRFRRMICRAFAPRIRFGRTSFSIIPSRSLPLLRSLPRWTTTSPNSQADSCCKMGSGLMPECECHGDRLSRRRWCQAGNLHDQKRQNLRQREGYGLRHERQHSHLRRRCLRPVRPDAG